MPIRMSGLVSNLDTDAIIKELMSAQTMKRTKVEQNKTKLEWKKEKWEEMNTKIYSLYTDQLSKLKLEGTYLAKKVTSSNEAKVKASATNASNGSYALKINSLASAQYVTGANIGAKALKSTSTMAEAGMQAGSIVTVKTGEDLDKSTAIEITADMTVADFAGKLNSAGVNASYDEANGRFFISAKESGSDNKFTVTSDAAAGQGLDAIGLGDITEALAASGLPASGGAMTIIAASDASIELNGAALTAGSNKVTVNGLTLELTGSTASDETINLTVGNDTDKVYDMVKESITKYNELLKYMNDAFSAKSAKGYDVLTDEQKEAMSEEQVKLWENKIKDSLLRRDTTLDSLMSTMRSALQEQVEVDGKNYSLSTYGIVTGVYTEQGQLHINGNKDDGEYANKTDELKKALDADPETVSKVLSKTFSSLYSKFTEKMSVTTISSALTFYNDKQMKEQIDDYAKDISDWDDRLTEMEDRYYRQYSVMETSMAKLQKQQSSLANMLK